MKQDIKQKIEDAVAAFCTKEVFEAGIELFDTLGYDTSLRSPLDEKTFSEFESLYIESSVNKERFNKKNAFCNDWKSIDILFQLTDDSFSQNGQLFDSKVNPLNPQSYLCFAVELSKSEYTKTQLARITREINKLFPIPILVVFKYGEEENTLVTLSVINRRVNKKDSERDVLEKVTLIKDIVAAKPHRAHIEILCDMSIEELNKTYEIHSFETLHKAWAAVLDTQTLNKRFYTELSNWYFWAMQTVEYPNSSDNAKNLIRLLTRLLFVWFIKEKDLIPEEFFDENKIQDIITVFNPHTVCESENKENESIYYKAILQNLFFASLNAEQGKRAFRLAEQNQNATNLMRYKRFLKAPDEFTKLIESKVPFMNGGLFECLDHPSETEKGKQGGSKIVYEDGFSDRKDNALFVPDYIFFAKDVLADLSKEYDDKKKKDVVVNGIIRILQKYKFTVQENTPVEEDIALDPELLGRVFENLLASYNPETKTNARKQTGSFYTPRAIVEYMVDESLKAYLKEKMLCLSKISTQARNDAEKDIEQKLSDLIAYNDKQADFTDEERIAILRCIDECKILDPACGSGAFPMGVLQKMVYVIHKLDPQNDNWKQIQIQKISSDKSLSVKEMNELQKEILSVFDDNELDYARKLYLIENCIHGIDIQPIATQISRLRFFISLIVDQKADKEKANFGVRPLPNLENRLVTANSLIGLDGEKGLTSQRTEELTSELQKVRHELFKAKTPKYKKALRERDKEIREELKDELLQLGFGKENALLISSWNPYDKNKCADFFDAEWMFGVKDGFDIVIGNPPYGAKVSAEDKKYYTKNYEVAKTIKGMQKGSTDTFAIFINQGFNSLKIGGQLAYIVPMAVTSSDAMTALHNMLEKNCRTIHISSYSNRPKQIFDAACIRTSIIQFEKTGTKTEKVYTSKLVRRSESASIPSLIEKLTFVDSYKYKLSGRYAKIGSEEELKIVEKLFSTGKKLEDYKKESGKAFYYRTSGGRYFNVITTFSTGSSKETFMLVENSNIIAAILSTSLFWFYQQIYTNGLDLKQYEINAFPVPEISKISKSKIAEIEKKYAEYLVDIDKNAIVHKTSSYNVDSFKEYKIRKSKNLIDELDDLICPLYNLSQEQTEFIKSYEIQYRVNDDE